LIEEMLERSPEWAIYQGRYEHAGEVSIPDAERRRGELAFIASALERLQRFDRDALPVDRRTDYDLLRDRLESSRFYIQTLKPWEWQPPNYNVAGPLSILLNSEFAPLPERLTLIRTRLEAVPAYYQAARASLGTPTLEHTELAIGQNRGALSVLADIRRQAAAGEHDDELSASLTDALDTAEAAINDWVSWLEDRLEALRASGKARSFRLGETLYEQKFAHDIQADFTAAQLYRRAQEEKRRLLTEMDGYTRELWPKYFADEAMPEGRLERIGQMIDRLSDEHVAAGDFVDHIRRQMPRLAEF